MPDVAVKVEGADELRRALRRVADAGLKAQLTETHKRMSRRVLQRALPNVPVRSGRLKGSVKAQATLRSASVKAGTAGRVKYAAAIHWGRKRGNVGSPPGNRKGRNVIRGRPFLQKAAEDLQASIRDQYADEITDLIERAVRNAT